MARSDLRSTSLTSRPAQLENRDGERPRVVSENEIVDAQEQLAALGHENWHVRAADEKRFAIVAYAANQSALAGFAGLCVVAVRSSYLTGLVTPLNGASGLKRQTFTLVHRQTRIDPRVLGIDCHDHARFALGRHH